MSLSGKVAVVTGAGSGIGAATAVLFAREGARVALVDLSETGLNQVAQQCAAHGTAPLIIKANVTNDLETKAIIKSTVDHFGQLDVLVNNAGIIRKALITDKDILQNFDLVMNTNLRSVIHLTSLAATHLAATKGNIINICSVSSRWVNAGNSSYCVSKIGVEHFTRCAALELAASGVRVNSVHPGPVRTNIYDCYVSGSLNNRAWWDKLKTTTALDKLAEPTEIADVVMFLASDKARSVTGSAYFSDNGFLLKH